MIKIQSNLPTTTTFKTSRTSTTSTKFDKEEFKAKCLEFVECGKIRSAFRVYEERNICGKIRTEEEMNTFIDKMKSNRTEESYAKLFTVG